MKRGRTLSFTPTEVVTSQPAYATVQQVRRMVTSAASKTADVREQQYYLLLAPNDDGAVSSAFGSLPQGDDDAYRQGQEVHLRSMTIRGRVSSNSATSPCVFRVVIFKWLEDTTIGGEPTLPSILASPSTGGALIGGGAYVYAGYNNDRKKSYVILKDYLTTLGDNEAANYMGIPPQRVFTWNIKSKKLGKITFTGAGNTITGKGQIYCVAVSDHDTEEPQVQAVAAYTYDA